MSQSKKQSLIEACTNTAVGFIIAVIGTFFIFWLLDIKSTPSKNILSTIFFTALSIVRGYFVRRFFNNKRPLGWWWLKFKYNISAWFYPFSHKEQCDIVSKMINKYKINAQGIYVNKLPNK